MRGRVGGQTLAIAVSCLARCSPWRVVYAVFVLRLCECDLEHVFLGLSSSMLCLSLLGLSSGASWPGLFACLMGHSGLVSLSVWWDTVAWSLCLSDGTLWPSLFAFLWGIVAWSFGVSDGTLWPGLFTCLMGCCGLVSLPVWWDIVTWSLYLSSGTLWSCLFTCPMGCSGLVSLPVWCDIPALVSGPVRWAWDVVTRSLNPLILNWGGLCVWFLWLLVKASMDLF